MEAEESDYLFPVYNNNAGRILLPAYGAAARENIN